MNLMYVTKKGPLFGKCSIYFFHSFDRLWCRKWKKLDFGHAILRYLIYFHFGNFAKIFVQLYHGKLTSVPIHSVARLVLLRLKQFL